jgi:phenylalanyl-tRNA synthetase beta chain
LTELKSLVESVLKNLDYNYTIKEFNHPSFIESRCGEILVDNKRIGFFGEVHPQVLENWKLENPVIAFEIEVV